MTGRDRMVVIVIAVLALIAGSYLFVLSPRRSQASKLSSQITTAQQQLDAAKGQVTAGLQARGQFASGYATMVRLGEAVPTDDDVPSLIYQLQGAADATHVNFMSLSLNNSSGSATGPAAAKPPTSSPGATSGSATQASSASLPPGATVGPAGFPVEQFTFSFQGDFFHLGDFFNRLERFVVANNTHMSVSGRLMTLNAISLGPGAKGFPQISAAISATTYLLPSSQGLTNGATPSGPSTPPASSVATSSSSAAPSAATITPPIK